MPHLHLVFLKDNKVSKCGRTEQRSWTDQNDPSSSTHLWDLWWFWSRRQFLARACVDVRTDAPQNLRSSGPLRLCRGRLRLRRHRSPAGCSHWLCNSSSIIGYKASLAENNLVKGLTVTMYERNVFKADKQKLVNTPAVIGAFFICVFFIRTDRPLYQPYRVLIMASSSY